jgi:soluble lytic murein transglycosylase
MPAMLRITRIWVPALLLALITLGAVPAAGAQSDRDFLDARAAFERGDRIRLDALAPKLADHVLAPYVEYWQRKLNLDNATDADINA